MASTYLEGGPLLCAGESIGGLPKDASCLLPPVFGIESECLEVKPTICQDHKCVSLVRSEFVWKVSLLSSLYHQGFVTAYLGRH